MLAVVAGAGALRGPALAGCRLRPPVPPQRHDCPQAAKVWTARRVCMQRLRLPLFSDTARLPMACFRLGFLLQL
ncbi:hypothetical protein AQI70_32690 [Streptomyces curacoi]|uniref:Uncharacterized protein n=1 Tax=Streptomyces curacoi TaxID=146536 RepID=A0A117NWL6_9ACTN|nr:hypothetical protein AQI70_32690 [Streptomyces curacoi]